MDCGTPMTSTAGWPGLFRDDIHEAFMTLAAELRVDMHLRPAQDEGRRGPRRTSAGRPQPGLLWRQRDS
jgi:hypothetical protein